MKKLTRLTPNQRSNLVAYLDGELEENEAKEIEQVLTTSPVARNEVETLSRTWKLLDNLPQAVVSEEFTQRTISQVKLETAAPPLLSEQRWFEQTRRGLIVLGWVVGLTLMSLLGFSITNYWIRDPHADLIQELPVVDNVEKYREIGSVEFLDELKNSGLFDENSSQQ